MTAPAGRPAPPGPPGPPSTDPPAYVARTPVDLIALVPYVLGFHPSESVVLLTFGSPQGSFHARVDLPRTRADRAQVVRTLCHAVRTNRAETAVVLVFSADHGAASRVAVELVPALLVAGVAVIDAIRADGQRWWCIGPDDAATAPDDPPGPGCAYDVGSHPFTAARVYDGHAAFADRAALEASLRPGTSSAERADRRAVAQAAAEAADEVVARLVDGVGSRAALREDAHWLRTCVVQLGEDRSERPGAPVAARIGFLVQLPVMRDVVSTVLAREGAATQVRVWRDLLVRMPDDLVPGVAAVLAMAAWLSGEGALAWCAIERCEEATGDDEAGARAGRSLAAWIGTLLREARSPHDWRGVGVDHVPLLAAGPPGDDPGDDLDLDVMAGPGRGLRPRPGGGSEAPRGGD